ncbi:MAG: P-II family nitrogen regulator [Candidatus Methanomethylophilaceae archaeon]|jgi:nitrogen regulatory protein P-II 1|nr:P-II family nitrogen regulator [Candidatus Methanomethylophilaceae archaeon]
MKLITAMIRPDMCQAVKDALKREGQNGMTMTQVHGRGTQAGLRFTTRVGDILVDEIEKTRVDVVVEDDSAVRRLADAIAEAAYTGHNGDGIIMVTPIETFVRIREMGDAKRSGEGKEPSRPTDN